MEAKTKKPTKKLSTKLLKTDKLRHWPFEAGSSSEKRLHSNNIFIHKRSHEFPEQILYCRWVISTNYSTIAQNTLFFLFIVWPSKNYLMCRFNTNKTTFIVFEWHFGYRQSTLFIWTILRMNDILWAKQSLSTLIKHHSLRIAYFSEFCKTITISLSLSSKVFFVFLIFKVSFNLVLFLWKIGYQIGSRY